MNIMLAAPERTTNVIIMMTEMNGEARNTVKTKKKLDQQSAAKTTRNNNTNKNFNKSDVVESSEHAKDQQDGDSHKEEPKIVKH